MGILSSIFSSSKERGKLVDGAVSGLDKMFYTEEEKADSYRDMREWWLRYLEASQPQNLSRRLLAFIVAAVWGGLVIGGAAVYHFSVELSEYVFKVLEEHVTGPFMLVMGFYFGAHVLRQVVGQVKGKK